ncbi:chromosome transmission fidelity protein 18 homolog [Vanessa tameamea]|uniref:Chromosome transmission fidelity protein 18 homolog n=1 Tax=Vanessa tameamea TaxID=334116 RepID=A0ABM4AQQ4_VANTA
MGDYPDPDEEYELMYSDELDLLRDMDENSDSNPVRKKLLPAKRSLDFSSPIANKIPVVNETCNTNAPSNEHVSISLTPSLTALDDVLSPNVSNKRTVEDLFGDINDIDFDNIQLPSKRQKTEEESDMELIDKIIESRKLRQILAEPTSRGIADSGPDYDINENLTTNVPTWPFMSFTTWNGDRVYVRLECEDLWEKSLDAVTNQLSLKTTYASVWAEARKILETKKQQQETPNDSEEIITNKNVNELWVEKYKPKSYVDLLSDEPVNRTVLHWLHLWDKVVFKKDVKTKEPHQRNAFSKRTGQFQLSNKWKGKKEDEPELDDDGRPHHKVVLLCGPPGVGKTTLAHLLAKLAGYRPVELNASDERSTEAFQTALQSATLMQSVLDRERRPNCLVLDEIDGAPIQTVELLVKWCTTSVKKEEGKKKNKTQPLKRPVIAICNDLYATSLRPLRACALVVAVRGAGAARVCARLRRVARAEGVRVSARALAALGARAGGDVRAALQLLAFLEGRFDGTINIEDVENAAIGTRDNTTSMMQALQAIFTINDNNPNSILKTIQAAGEYDRIIEGIFENYLAARVDSRLLIACETTSWLRLYDAINTWIQRNQNYSMYSFLPLCIARCHGLLASRQTTKVKFPLQAQETSRRRAELESAVCGVRAARADVSRLALRLDLLPLLPYVLSPALRSANVQLCSESERKSLRTCAGAMCDYGLRYTQQRTLEGLYAFVLEPDIYKVAFFGTEERIRPPPAIRQAIAREQQLEVIRRNENMMNRMGNKTQSSEVKQKTDKRAANRDAAQLPNHLQRLQPKVIEKKTTTQVHKDFFGRIVPISQVHKQDAVSDVISSSDVFYQYREGFNNAVRRNVRLRDLL